MAKVVLITGASSGIGLETARLFARRGWTVIATMRTPARAPDFGVPGIETLRLDVTDAASVEEAVAEALRRHGRIDAVVNNAGYGAIGPFEAATEAQIERQFSTNVFGPMRVIRAVLPAMREQGGGVIVNVSSMGGKLTFPLYSLYHGTKFALEGFSESLQYEVEGHGIRVKLVEPGAIKTDFYERSQDVMSQPGLTAYDSVVRRAMPAMKQAGERGAPPSQVAAVILRAATDRSARLRYPVGSSAILLMRKWLPDAIFHRLIRWAVLGRV